MYAIKLGTQLSIDIVQPKKGESLLDFCYREIGCDMIEMVRPKGLDRPFLLVIDEEGLLKDEPVVNFIGSYLYRTQEHGNPIVGEVLIMQDIDTNSGPDIGFLTEDQAWAIAGKMMKIAVPAFKTVRKALQRNGVLEKEAN